MAKNVIYSINDSVITVADTTDFSMQEMVYVGHEKLIGEVIEVRRDQTVIQVYEVTGGLSAGEPVEPTGQPMSVTLGPGILTNIFDGIQRPLPAIEQQSGAFITRGSSMEALPTDFKWDVTPCVQVGDAIAPGVIYATCPETESITHRLMVSPLASCGVVTWVAQKGLYALNDTVLTYQTQAGQELALTLCQKWPIRQPRPFAKRLPCDRPLITGQRIVDTIVPVAKGGTAAIPGGFGTGKTMMQHQLA